MNHHMHDLSLRHSLICSRPVFDHDAIHRADVLAARRQGRRRRVRIWARTLPDPGVAGRPTSVGGGR